jgi:glycosyltransferase involved in cell wall biosynthesis
MNQRQLTMKILIFRHSLLNRGGDKMIVSHANYLASRGYDVIIQMDKATTLFPLDERVTCVPMRWKGKIGTLLTALGRRKGYDRIIADIIPLALLLSLCNRCRVIYYAQDYDESYYSHFAQKLFVRALYALGLGLLNIRTIAVSTRLEETFWKRFRSRVAVVENGIDPEKFHRNPDQLLVTGKERRIAILALSRSDRRKGFDVALKVMELLEEQFPQTFEFWTVGERVSGLNAGSIHRDFGYLGGAALARVMSSADMMLYPSRHEGFPLMVVEAFACGCPVVTTHAVCFAHNGENALVCAIEDARALADACRRLATDRALSQHLAHNGLAFAQEHHLNDTLAQFERELVASHVAASRIQGA